MTRPGSPSRSRPRCRSCGGRARARPPGFGPGDHRGWGPHGGTDRARTRHDPASHSHGHGHGGPWRGDLGPMAPLRGAVPAARGAGHGIRPALGERDRRAHRRRPAPRQPSRAGHASPPATPAGRRTRTMPGARTSCSPMRGGPSSRRPAAPASARSRRPSPASARRAGAAGGPARPPGAGLAARVATPGAATRARADPPPGGRPSRLSSALGRASAASRTAAARVRWPGR